MRVGLLWRAEWDAERDVERCRLHAMFAAFRGLGVDAEPVVWSDGAPADLRGLDGVLVWVNPVEQGLDRSVLDPALREAAAAGTFVSAHPDVILRLATKQVLADTAGMSWSAETHLYRTAEQLREELPARLDRGPRVLKQHRGMGGSGVWKVERDGEAVIVQHAAAQSPPERLSLDAFVRRCEPYFGGPMVEQSFQERLGEGMIRVYLSHGEVVGFAHQYPRGLMPPDVPSPHAEKRFFPAGEERFARLRREVDGWLPELRQIARVELHDLPVIWDIDFLYGPRTPVGEDTYVICEINASSTFAFPEHAMPAVARNALERIAERP